MKPTPEQLKDPKWWDENAPEGAMYYDKSEDDEGAPFLKVNEYNQWRYWCPINMKWKQIKASLIANDESTIISRPTHSVAATEKAKRSKYHRLIAFVDMPDGSKHEVWIDVYDVIKAWGVTNPAQQHLIKKALQAGDRGHKDYAEDIDDIIASAKRAKELNAPTR